MQILLRGGEVKQKSINQLRTFISCPVFCVFGDSVCTFTCMDEEIHTLAEDVSDQNILGLLIQSPLCTQRCNYIVYLADNATGWGKFRTVITDAN